MKESNPRLIEESIKSGLPNNLLDDIDSIFIKDLTESTNDDAKNHLKVQKALFSVHLAEKQIAGRGRNNRKWVSPHGKNIYISLGWKSKLIHSQLEGLSLAVAACLISSLKEFSSQNIQIKWPNDLLIDKKKISGVLIETSDSGEGLDVVIGIGINVHMNTAEGAEIDQDWGNLEENHSNKLDRNKIVQSIISKLHELFNEYPQSGFKKYRNTFESYNLLKDKLCKVEMDRETFEGKVIGVNETGEFLVEKDEEIRHLRYGEVSIREL